MSLHERAFVGLKIVILGDTPLLPMKIEQAIARVYPHQEVQHAFSAKMIGKNSKLLDYLPVSSFLKETEIPQSLEALWNEFTTTYDHEVMPQVLQDLILSVVEEKVGSGERGSALYLPFNQSSDFWCKFILG